MPRPACLSCARSSLKNPRKRQPGPTACIRICSETICLSHLSSSPVRIFGRSGFRVTNGTLSGPAKLIRPAGRKFTPRWGNLLFFTVPVQPIRNCSLPSLMHLAKLHSFTPLFLLKTDKKSFFAERLPQNALQSLRESL